MSSFKNTVISCFTLMFAIACFLIVLSTPAISLAQDLYHAEVNSKSKEGKDLISVCDEIERHENFSIISIKHTSGASVPSVMFIVKACCEIAELRDMKYFVNLKEWDDEQGNRLYKIGYTSNKKNDPNIYFGEDIDKTKNLEYLSVKDFMKLFETE